MIIDIDDGLLDSRTLTRVRELVDRLDVPGVEITQTRQGVVITKARVAPLRYIIVARSHYQAQEYIYRNGYNMDECAITLCDIDGHFAAPNFDNVTVEFATYHVT